MSLSWKFDNWYQALPPCDKNFCLTPLNRRIENCNQNKHSVENTIGSSDISFHIHACMHPHNENWKWKLFARRTMRDEMKIHPLHCIVSHPRTTPTNYDSRAATKKYFKIICAIWFDDVSPANHLMIIYCHCR